MGNNFAGGEAMLKISELQSKDVVNIIDGKKLGSICDLDIDLHRGRVDAIICPGDGKFFGLFASGDDIVIPWRNIVKIGSDVILIRLEDPPYVLNEPVDKSESELNHKTNENANVYRPYRHDADK